jgi:peroxiredoxin
MISRRTALGLLAASALPLPGWAKPPVGLVIADAPKPLPALDIKDQDGKPVTLDSLAGKAVVLNLWASWCMPCVAELPALDRLVPKARAMGIEVVALSLDRGGKVTVVNTYARLGITSLAIRTDETRRAAETLGAPGLPTTLLLDAKGREVARLMGAAEWDGAGTRPLLEALAAAKPITAAMAPPPVTLHGNP